MLKVGAGVGGAEENRRGLKAMIFGSLMGAGYPLLAKMKLVAEEAAGTFSIGAGATNLSAGLSLAYIGVGHLVGLSVGLAMLAGIIIGFIVLLPIFTAAGPPPGIELADYVGTVFREKVRFVGAGAIGVAAIWTLLKVIGPIARGIVSALAANRARRAGGDDSVDITERDIPITIVGAVILLSMIPIGLLLNAFASTNPIAANPGAHPRRQYHLRPDRRCADRRGLRLYGGPDRRIEQPDLRRRHPRCARHRADPCRDVRANGRRSEQGAGRLRIVRHRNSFWYCNYFERQFAGSENRPIGRSDPMAAAILLDPGRDFRRCGHSADPRYPEPKFGFVGAPGAGPTRSPRRKRR